MGFFDRFKENKDALKTAKSAVEAESLDQAYEIMNTPTDFWDAVGRLRISIEHQGDDPDEVMRFRQFFAQERWNEDITENLAVFIAYMNEIWVRVTILSLKGFTPDKIASMSENYRILIEDDNAWHHIAKTQWIVSIVQKEHGHASCTTELFWNCWNQSTEHPEKIDKMLQQWDEETIMKFRGICS